MDHNQHQQHHQQHQRQHQQHQQHQSPMIQSRTPPPPPQQQQQPQQRPRYVHRSSGGTALSHVPDNDDEPPHGRHHVIHSRTATQSHGLPSRARSRSKGRKARGGNNAPSSGGDEGGAAAGAGGRSNVGRVDKSRRRSQQEGLPSSGTNTAGGRTSSRRRGGNSDGDGGMSRSSSWGDVAGANSNGNGNGNDRAIDEMIHQGKIDHYGRCTRHPNIELCRRGGGEANNNSSGNSGGFSWRILLQDCPLCSMDDSAAAGQQQQQKRSFGISQPRSHFGKNSDSAADSASLVSPPPTQANKTVDSTQTAATATTEEASSVRSWTVSDASSSEDEGTTNNRSKVASNYGNNNNYNRNNNNNNNNNNPRFNSPTPSAPSNTSKNNNNNPEPLHNRFSPPTTTPPPRRPRNHTKDDDDASKKSSSRRRGHSRTSRRSTRSSALHRKSSSASATISSSATTATNKPSQVQSLKDLGKRLVQESEEKRSSSLLNNSNYTMGDDASSVGGRSTYSSRSNYHLPPPPSRTRESGRSQHPPPPIGVSKRSSFHKEEENEGGGSGKGNGSGKRSGGSTSTSRKGFNTSLSSLSAKELSDLRRQRLGNSASDNNSNKNYEANPNSANNASQHLRKSNRIPPPRRATCDGGDMMPSATSSKATEMALGEASSILSRIARHMSDQRAGSFNGGDVDPNNINLDDGTAGGLDGDADLLLGAAEARQRAKQLRRSRRRPLSGGTGAGETMAGEGLSTEWEEPMSTGATTADRSSRAKRNVDRSLERRSRGRDETAIVASGDLPPPQDDILGAAAAIRNRARRSLSRSRERCREAAIFCGETPPDDDDDENGDGVNDGHYLESGALRNDNMADYADERALVEVKRSILNPHGLSQPEVPTVQRRSQSRGRSDDGRHESPGLIRHGSRGRDRNSREEDPYHHYNHDPNSYDNGIVAASDNNNFVPTSGAEALLIRRREMRQKIAERQNAVRSKKDRHRADSTESIDQEGYQSGGYQSGGYQSGGYQSGDGHDNMSLKQQVMEEWGSIASVDKKSTRSGRLSRKDKQGESKRGRSRSAVRESFSRIRSASLRALGKKGSKVDLDNLPPAGHNNRSGFDDNSTVDTGKGSKSSFFRRRLSLGKNSDRPMSRGKMRSDDSIDFDRCATRSDSFFLGKPAWQDGEEDKQNRSSFLRRMSKGSKKYGRAKTPETSRGLDSRSFTHSDDRIGWEGNGGDFFASKSSNVRSLSRGSFRPDDSDARSVRSAAKSESFAMNRRAWEDNYEKRKSSRPSLFNKIGGKVKHRSRSRGRRGSFGEGDNSNMIDSSTMSESYAFAGSPWEIIEPSRASSGSAMSSRRQRSKGASSEIVRSNSVTNPFLD